MAFFPRHLVATAVVAALSWPVLAQPTPPAAPAAPSTQAQTDAAAPTDWQMQRGHQRAQMQERMQERMAQHQAALKQSLQLTPAQEPAWNAFIGTMQPGQRTARLGPLSPGEMQQLTTPERIERMRAQRAQRSAEADRMGDAVKTFYAQLTPAQQKTFDAQTLRHHHMGGKGGMGGMGMGMGGMGYRDGGMGYGDGGKNCGEDRPGMGRRGRAPASVPAATQ